MRLQNKILFLVVPMVVLPLAGLGWAAHTKLKQTSEEALLGQLHTAVNQVGRSATTHLATARANTELFAGSHLLKKYVLTTDETDRYALMQPALMRLFASYQRAYPNYYELRIVLPGGYEDIRSTLDPLPNKTEYESEAELFDPLRETDEGIHARYGYNPDNGKPALYVTKKLLMRDDAFEPVTADPTLRGYLVITAGLEFLQEQLNGHRVGANGHLFLTDASGRPLLTPQDTAVEPLTPQQQSELQEALSHDRFAIIDRGGEPSYLHRHELTPDFHLWGALPESDLRVAGNDLTVFVTGVTVVTVAVASALLLHMINLILLDPIKKLRRAAEEIGSGRFDARAGITSHDELGELGWAFEEMGRDLQKYENRVARLAYHDALTGLPNRRMFLENLRRAMAHARRSRTGLALLFLDLDNFKRINDTMGHLVGDQLLRELSQRLRRGLREEDELSWLGDQQPGEVQHDTVARIGGDEFLILLPWIKDPREAAIVAQRLLELVNRPFNINDNDFFVGGSIGISLYPNDGKDIKTLIKSADMAMYHAKQNQRNGYKYFDESMNAAAVERLLMENELRKAIREKEFSLHYQPKVDIRNGELTGVEGLLRWNHPNLGMVLPDRFIPVAEESGLILPIGEWIIDEATHQISKWRKDGIDLCLSINISTVQLNRQHLVELLQHYLEKNACPADRLELELTETSIMDACDHSLATLNRIKKLGVRISMDDFGAGYSSFNALRSLPVDILKIDRSFIRDIAINKNDAAITSAILAMAHTLNLQVVAEGVETSAQLHFLRNRECDIVQGYLVSRPLTEPALRQFLARAEIPRDKPVCNGGQEWV